MATIELVNVAHAYVPGKYAVRDINLKWENGINSALLGPSGCGKTTLLKIISGLLRPSEGRVLLDGEDVTDKRPKDRNIAQVFQFPVVYETLNIYDNLAFPLRNRDVDAKVVDRRVHEIAEILEMTDKLKMRAAQLGAAEKQLVSLGRGIVREDITAILLDEPLTVIDPHQKLSLRRKLKQLQRDTDFTMIYVTHDQQEALTFADQVTVMNTGVALQTGSPEKLHDRPAAPFVGYFIGSPGMNIFDAQLEGEAAVASDFSVPLSADVVRHAQGKKLQVGIRPEFIQVSKTAQSDAFEATIEAVYMTGNAKILDISGAGLRFKVRVKDTMMIESGAKVWVTFPSESLIVYADERAIEFDVVEEVV